MPLSLRFFFGALCVLFFLPDEGGAAVKEALDFSGTLEKEARVYDQPTSYYNNFGRSTVCQQVSPSLRVCSRPGLDVAAPKKEGVWFFRVYDHTGVTTQWLKHDLTAPSCDWGDIEGLNGQWTQQPVISVEPEEICIDQITVQGEPTTAEAAGCFDDTAVKYYHGDQKSITIKDRVNNYTVCIPENPAMIDYKAVELSNFRYDYRGLQGENTTPIKGQFSTNKNNPTTFRAEAGPFDFLFDYKDPENSSLGASGINFSEFGLSQEVDAADRAVAKALRDFSDTEQLKSSREASFVLEKGAYVENSGLLLSQKLESNLWNQALANLNSPASGINQAINTLSTELESLRSLSLPEDQWQELETYLQNQIQSGSVDEEWKTLAASLQSFNLELEQVKLSQGINAIKEVLGKTKPAKPSVLYPLDIDGWKDERSAWDDFSIRDYSAYASNWFGAVQSEKDSLDAIENVLEVGQDWLQAGNPEVELGLEGTDLSSDILEPVSSGLGSVSSRAQSLMDKRGDLEQALEGALQVFAAGGVPDSQTLEALFDSARFFQQNIQGLSADADSTVGVLGAPAKDFYDFLNADVLTHLETLRQGLEAIEGSIEAGETRSAQLLSEVQDLEIQLQEYQEVLRLAETEYEATLTQLLGGVSGGYEDLGVTYITIAGEPDSGAPFEKQFVNTKLPNGTSGTAVWDLNQYLHQGSAIFSRAGDYTLSLTAFDIAGNKMTSPTFYIRVDPATAASEFLDQLVSEIGRTPEAIFREKLEDIARMSVDGWIGNVMGGGSPADLAALAVENGWILEADKQGLISAIEAYQIELSNAAYLDSLEDYDLSGVGTSLEIDCGDDNPLGSAPIANGKDSCRAEFQFTDRYGNIIKTNSSIMIEAEKGDGEASNFYDLTQNVDPEMGLRFKKNPDSDNLEKQLTANSDPEGKLEPFYVTSWLPTVEVQESNDGAGFLMRPISQVLRFNVRVPQVDWNGNFINGKTDLLRIVSPVRFDPWVKGKIQYKTEDGSCQDLDAENPIQVFFDEQETYCLLLSTEKEATKLPNLMRVAVQGHTPLGMGFSEYDLQDPSENRFVVNATSRVSVVGEFQSALVRTGGAISQTNFALSSLIDFAVDDGGSPLTIRYPGGNLSNAVGEKEQQTFTPPSVESGENPEKQGIGLNHHLFSSPGDPTSPINCVDGWIGCSGEMIQGLVIEADIEGDILGAAGSYSYTSEGSTGGSSNILELGGISTQDVREEITQSAYRLIRGLEPQTEDTFDWTGGISFSDADLKYVRGGTVRLGGTIEGVGTIVIEDGNLVVEEDLSYENGASLGVILLNTASESYPKIGNIYVDPEVKNMVGVYFSDGGIMSLSPLWDTSTGFGYSAEKLWGASDISNRDGLKNQLLIEGTILTRNTLGGSELTQPRTPWEQGESVTLALAERYDLHYLRRYDGQTGPNCVGYPICDSNRHATVVRTAGSLSSGSTPPGFQTLTRISR
jgi:hypothetical protein